jgi:two-component system response regulator GlrR
MDDARRTVEHRPPPGLEAPTVRRFRLVGVEGLSDLDWTSTGDRCSIGSHPSNDVRIEDETVSRFHCEIRIAEEGTIVRDLGSRNGTVLDGIQVREAYLKHGATMRLGKVALRFELDREANPMPVSASHQFGDLVGRSDAMRVTFALLARAAQSDATILLEGETGTGKGAAAEAVHRASARRDGPLVVVDCTAIPANLLEAELFGHERGAFTGAVARRLGAIEEADGGTLFLDEIGEMPLDLQPKLLRVLEERTVRRVGANVHKAVDLRVIAATNRDLRGEVNEKRFRADLYFRLSVAKIVLPPLRERAADIPLLVERFLQSLRAPTGAAAGLLAPEMQSRLATARWPGNVRELRNYVERFIVFGEDVEQPSSGERPRRLPFFEARQRAMSAFEKQYLAELAEEFGSRTVQAANAAGLDRVHLYRLLRRNGLR